MRFTFDPKKFNTIEEDTRGSGIDFQYSPSHTIDHKDKSPSMIKKG